MPPRRHRNWFLYFPVLLFLPLFLCFIPPRLSQSQWGAGDILSPLDGAMTTKLQVEVDFMANEDCQIYAAFLLLLLQRRLEESRMLGSNTTTTCIANKATPCRPFSPKISVESNTGSQRPRQMMAKVES